MADSREFPGIPEREFPVALLAITVYDAIPSTSFGDDMSVQLVTHATEVHSEAIKRLVNGNFINLTSQSTFLAAFHFAFKHGSSELAERLLALMLD